MTGGDGVAPPPIPFSQRTRNADRSRRTLPATTDVRYGRCLENSRRIRWDIDKDVIRGREFDFSVSFLPDGLSMISRLHVPERRRSRGC